MFSCNQTNNAYKNVKKEKNNTVKVSNIQLWLHLNIVTKMISYQSAKRAQTSNVDVCGISILEPAESNKAIVDVYSAEVWV